MTHDLLMIAMWAGGILALGVGVYWVATRNL